MNACDTHRAGVVKAHLDILVLFELRIQRWRIIVIIGDAVVASFARGLVILGQTEVIRARIFFITYQVVIVVVAEWIRVVSAVSVAKKFQIRVHVVNSIIINIVSASNESAMVLDQIIWMICLIVFWSARVKDIIVVEESIRPTRE